MTKQPRKTDPTAPQRIALPAVIDLPRACTLKAEFDTARGAPVVVAAAAVERIGGLGQQLLFAAAQSWAADGTAFAISDPSEGFTASATALGLDFTPFVEGAKP